MEKPYALSGNFARGGPSSNQTDFPWDLSRANLSTHAAFPLFVPKCIMNCNVEVSNIDWWTVLCNIERTMYEFLQCIVNGIVDHIVHGNVDRIL